MAFNCSHIPCTYGYLAVGREHMDVSDCTEQARHAPEGSQLLEPVFPGRPGGRNRDMAGGVIGTNSASLANQKARA
ncbi:hypothetical protein V2G26_020116 [Clonostachys chloroleuca]